MPSVKASQPDAADLVSRALAQTPATDRVRFLRELLAHTAAGLVILDGHAEAAEAAYRLGDAVVARGALQ